MTFRGYLLRTAAQATNRPDRSVEKRHLVYKGSKYVSAPNSRADQALNMHVNLTVGFR